MQSYYKGEPYRFSSEQDPSLLTQRYPATEYLDINPLLK